MNDFFDEEYSGDQAKNFFYVNGTQNNYTINMSENSSLKIISDGKPILDIDEVMSCGDVVGKPLESDEAKEVFSKLRKAKILDKNNQPNGLSLTQCGVLASLISDRLDIDNPWKTFGDYWKINKETLRKASYDGYKQAKMSKFIDMINDVLH